MSHWKKFSTLSNNPSVYEIVCKLKDDLHTE